MTCLHFLSLSLPGKFAVVVAFSYKETHSVVLMKLFAGQEYRRRCREQSCGHSGGRRRRDELTEQHGHVYTALCKRASHWEATL